MFYGCVVRYGEREHLSGPHAETSLPLEFIQDMGRGVKRVVEAEREARGEGEGEEREREIFDVIRL